jgi:hypothetical protein
MLIFITSSENASFKTELIASSDEHSIVEPFERDFTIVLFPDTQYEVQSFPEAWESMPQWVADNKEVNNIQAVIGLGDVTNQHSASEFKEAVKSWDILDRAGIPYVTVIGNHDYDSLPQRSAVSWNDNFGIDRFSTKSWYGGAYQNSTENYWINLDIGSHKYLVLALEFFPRTQVLQWAQSIITANSDREVIIATHGYLNGNGSRTLHGHAYGPDDNDCDGQQVWNNLLKLDSKILLTVCGHQIGGPTSAYSSDTGMAGNTVHQLFINHQNENNGGNGYMALLKFRPSAGKVEMTTYSALLNSFDSSGVYIFAYAEPALSSTAQLVTPPPSPGS